MPQKNSKINKAAKVKDDEFYTQLHDIENEMRHYKGHFKGKVVYCNCDDPRESNFFHYFSHNFEHLGLKKLIATCYRSNDVTKFSEHNTKHAMYQIYEGDQNANKKPDDDEIDIKHLKGDGDFRSEECIELLKEADIVVTNPPFSLFREFIAQLMEYDKKFIIVGNFLSLYKEIRPLLLEQKFWAGVNNINNFIRPNGEIKKVNAVWYTNLEHDKRIEPLILTATYSPEKYPKFDNYDAINVDKNKDIPKDYDGIMGVPTWFLTKHNPEQFELVDFIASPTVNGENKFVRALIKRLP